MEFYLNKIIDYHPDPNLRSEVQVQRKTIETIFGKSRIIICFLVNLVVERKTDCVNFFLSLVSSPRLIFTFLLMQTRSQKRANELSEPEPLPKKKLAFLFSSNDTLFVNTKPEASPQRRVVPVPDYQ